jgi:hypothetical protein
MINKKTKINPDSYRERTKLEFVICFLEFKK